MGYYTRLEGRITITPPIAEKDWLDDARDPGDNVFVLEEEEGEQELALVDGRIEVVGDPSVLRGVMRYEEPVKAYSADQDVKNLVDWAKSHGSEINGFLYGTGEDSERWRIRIEANDIHSETPELVWPDGSKGWWKQ